MKKRDAPVLVFIPGEWRVELDDGSIATIRADGFSESDQEFVFTVLVRGEPNEEFVVAMIPAAAVRSVEGGPVS